MCLDSFWKYKGNTSLPRQLPPRTTPLTISPGEVHACPAGCCVGGPAQPQPGILQPNQDNYAAQPSQTIQRDAASGPKSMALPSRTSSHNQRTTASALVKMKSAPPVIDLTLEDSDVEDVKPDVRALQRNEANYQQTATSTAAPIARSGTTRASTSSALNFGRWADLCQLINLRNRDELMRWSEGTTPRLLTEVMREVSQFTYC